MALIQIHYRPVFVRGIKKGLALINALPDFDAIIIAPDGRVHYSSGLVE
jgi:thiamine biosynthesis lipoprotein